MDPSTPVTLSGSLQRPGVSHMLHPAPCTPRVMGQQNVSYAQPNNSSGSHWTLTWLCWPTAQHPLLVVSAYQNFSKEGNFTRPCRLTHQSIYQLGLIWLHSVRLICRLRAHKRLTLIPATEPKPSQHYAIGDTVWVRDSNQKGTVHQAAHIPRS